MNSDTITCPVCGKAAKGKANYINGNVEIVDDGEDFEGSEYIEHLSDGIIYFHRQEEDEEDDEDDEDESKDFNPFGLNY